MRSPANGGASEERLRFVQFALEHAHDIVAILDANGRVLHANQALYRRSGRTPTELGTAPLMPKVLQIATSEYQRLWAEAKDGETIFEGDVLAADGSHQAIEFTAAPVAHDGREALCLIGRDIRRRQAAERENARLQQQLQETQRLESLAVLAGGIAHDFNNLLTAIIGNTSLARESLDRPKAMAEMLRHIENAANQAAGLCRQMLAYSGQGQLLPEPLDLSAIIRSSTRLLEVTVDRRARLELQLAPELPHILADASQVRQLMLNLVHNAAEAVPENGHILVATCPVTVDRTCVTTARVRTDIPEGPGVRLTVADNGMGMEPETLQRIFEPFFTTKFTGRGLGLAAVLGIVRSHRALLHVESRPGGGTTFSITFSATRSVAALEPPVRLAPPPSPGGHVLVVDDESPVRQVTAQVLAHLGFVVELASNADAALATAAANPGRFTLLLIDLTMPGMDGPATLRELRRRGAAAPAILMSGLSEQQVRERVALDQVAGFLEKPFNMETLRAKVEFVLSAHAARPPAMIGVS